MINTGSGYRGGLQFAEGGSNAYGGERILARTTGTRRLRRDASYQSWRHNQEASDSSKKIANKAARKKYSASPSGRTIRVERADTLSKIARRHHLNGGWKCLWKLNRKTIKNPSLILIGQAIKIK
jgi:nucleoid-associated protein YgaU